jgi:hypothetical protein
VYFIIGAVYQKKYQEASGSDLVIHKGFWFAIPGYVKAS